MSQLEDPRIRAGMVRLLEERERMIAGGAMPLGWKLGFGSPSGLERMGLRAPLAGFLTDATLLSSGSKVDIKPWLRPVVEPEVAVYMDADLISGSDRQTVAAAIGSLGPAIELADVDLEQLEVESVLARNIFHRGLILGERDPNRAGGLLVGLTARVMVEGVEVGLTSELEALTGEMILIVGQLADLLTAAGERLRAGDIVITGSVVPPVAGVAGSEVVFHLRPFDPIRVRLG
jgi:2-keto-4-pentenoate hydratase